MLDKLLKKAMYKLTGKSSRYGHGYHGHNPLNKGFKRSSSSSQYGHGYHPHSNYGHSYYKGKKYSSS
ncbi:hypothetical protein ACFQWB_15530 [Paenibacillus thermoaerophilus]|uniref:Uncharacterized protein n=1 Tax=Paenibacillus thermoaerophilus TaxID=1215385 RepID=A0ABW2V8B1_9BACL|nr:hypothetical protein [Paenibacillus thermoaerophilus]TMV17865.1 hypothetical protein FE781_05265 [Paenibacillus thermoaerophilus]